MSRPGVRRWGRNMHGGGKNEKQISVNILLHIISQYLIKVVRIKRGGKQKLGVSLDYWNQLQHRIQG